MIRWTPALAVGIEEIDAQHQELFRRAERFLDSLQHSSRRDIGIMLSYLRLYCVTHFGAEEAWMRDVGFPGYVQHRAEHETFIEHLVQLSAEHEKRGGPGLQPVRVGSFLSRWLEDHVSRTDCAFAAFLLTRGG